MRFRGHVDANQAAIIKAVVAFGCSAVSLAAVGDGCPDILVGFRTGRGSAVNYLFEIKNPERRGKQRQLRETQQKFFDAWKGQVVRVESADEVLEFIRVARATL